MQRIAESGLAGSSELTALSLPGVALDRAALGEGESGQLLVGYSPQGGGSALFAVLALACSRAEFAGRVLAIAPDWSAGDRRRLGQVRPQRFELSALAAPQLGGESGEVQPAAPPEPLPVAPDRIAGVLPQRHREIFERALAGLRGLAAKHGGALRGLGDRVDLLLLARSVASLRASRAGVRLELTGPDRASLELSGDGLATALDRLEGSLRKRLNDRRIRASEEGLRANLIPVFEQAGSLHDACPWPLATDGAGPVDLVGVDDDGRLTVAAGRELLDLTALGEVLDAALDPRVQWPLLASGGMPVSAGGPRLLLAAREHDDVALQLLPQLSIDAEVFDVAERRGGPLRLARRELPERAVVQAAAPAPAEREQAAAPAPAEREPAAEPPRQPRRRQRAPRSRPAADAATPSASPEAKPAGSAAGSAAEESPAFDEVSLFDLEEDTAPEPSDSPSRRRRSRGGRRRGRRGQGAAPGDAAAGSDPSDETEQPAEREAPAERPSGARRHGRSAPTVEPEDDELVDEDGIAALADGAPEPEESLDLRYEDEDVTEEGDAEADRARREREFRRRARAAKSAPEPPRPPRRRAAFVAHADPVSVLTAIVLARDVRLVESFWVYPQEDLMTFFRSVATDLRQETPIFLVGFAASPPARDTLQAASLYRGRLHWFDHHPWPPEDLVSLGEAIGEDAVHIESGADSSLARVIAERTRRSRFSDKLVELVTGRFTQHDYERWGRLWWHRAGEIASRRGDRRADIEPLLAGRPSDLSKESARSPVPPPPAEVEFVSRKDFRLVHFGGYVMVVLEVPEGLDVHLSARIARERYEAQLSLASREGADLLVLGADESRSRRDLDLGGMAAHLASKHEWIRALSDDDHVARLSVRDLRTVSGRLDEVISEIAMGRSIIEG
jgi:hypothetical protein